MTTKMRTLDEIENEYQSRWVELTGLEDRLRLLHEKEWQILQELKHLEFQRERLKNLPGEVTEEVPAD